MPTRAPGPRDKRFFACVRRLSTLSCESHRLLRFLMAALVPIKGVTLDELRARLRAIGEPPFRAEQLAQWVFAKRVNSFAQMTDLPAALRDRLAAEFSLTAIELVRTLGAPDSTRKYLFRLSDGNLIETVLIAASPALYGEPSDRRTLCVSTQVGCAYGCKFCASGLDGWTRNLRADEIIDQLMRVEEVSGEKVNNLVFMGMGEPLANFEQVMRALGIFNAPWGLGIGARHMTISTSGLAPQIRQLADQPLQVRLAISLHGATDEVRSQIMPVNRKYPVATLLDACTYYARRKKQRITFEYILIDGVNDRAEDAAALARIVRALPAKVNCIPYNSVEGLAWRRPSRTRQREFMRILEGARVPATIRLEKGHEIAAACGQLRRQTNPFPAPAVVISERNPGPAPAS
jgi:23S rRNA (adenine2503-C2)-methyltransferase